LLAEVDGKPGTRALVLDLEATTQLDTTSADVLTHLAIQLETRGVSLYLARVLHGVNKVLQQSGFGDVIGPDRFWHSISQCVRAARRDTGLKGNGGGTSTKPERAAPTDDGEAEVEQVIEWEHDEASDGT
jgi:hypothetical protein